MLKAQIGNKENYRRNNSMQLFCDSSTENATTLPINSRVSIVNTGEECLTSFRFHIPAYQRPYSWGEEQIDEFLKTIMDGFNDNSLKFFGTMQFVDKKERGFDVVDGQQRLTTMKLFLYVLSGLAQENAFDFDISYNNMERVDDVIEDLLSRNISSVQEIDKDKHGKANIKDINSVFEANIRMLKEKLLKFNEDDSQKRGIKQYAHDLIVYFGKSIYVVVLKTDESLSLPEVVSIFNTINTTGMDLNSEDIFKFQYYDYLHKNCKTEESANNDDFWIEQINSCYRKIEIYNEGKPIKYHISMSDVLSVYQHCICAKYEDNYKVLAKSSERFFSDLFANPAKYKDLLKFSEFSRLVDEYISFYSELKKNKYKVNPLYALSMELIGLTRYPRYWTFPFVYSFLRGNDDKTKREALRVSYHVFSFLIVHSINYAKAINPIHTIICRDVLPAIQRGGDITAIVKSKQWSDPYENEENKKAQTYFKSALEKDAIRNSKVGVICLLLALYHEKDEDLEALRDKFFNWEFCPYDIEHIYSADSFSKSDKYSDDDKALFDGIGNLVILEQKINRDMGRKYILTPKSKYNHRDEYYEKSVYKIVKDFTPQLKTWDIENVKVRCEKQLTIVTTEILDMSIN